MYGSSRDKPFAFIEGLGDKRTCLLTNCGLHGHYVGAVERGERNITFEEAASIAKALRISLSELVRGV
jgi:hypothetical protein